MGFWIQDLAKYSGIQEVELRELLSGVITQWKEDMNTMKTMPKVAFPTESLIPGSHECIPALAHKETDAFLEWGSGFSGFYLNDSAVKAKLLQD